MHRLFVGVRPPQNVRAALLATMAGVPGARWQSEDQLHITLRFIGEVDRPLAEDVAIALGGIHAPPIDVALAGVGQFDRRGRTQALWAGVQPQEGLRSLHRKIDQLLVRCGLPPERRAYLPHITLARMNIPPGAAEGFLQANAGLASPPFRLDAFALFESHLGHEAARYEAVQRYPLRG